MVLSQILIVYSRIYLLKTENFLGTINENEIRISHPDVKFVFVIEEA